MQFQDSIFLILLLMLAALPIAAKGLAEIYIIIATLVHGQKEKDRKPPVLLKR
jgi:hypothetical protein